MADEFPPESPPDAPHDIRVRRLLANARHDEPMPADVAARLDRVLAGLAAEPSRVAPVTALATRRRRVTLVLAAAAAVVVVGVGIGQVVDRADPEASTSADRAASGDTLAEADPGAGAEGQSDAGSTEQAPVPQAGPGSPEDLVRGGVVDLYSAHFAAGAREARDVARGHHADGLFSAELDRSTAVAKSCRARAWGRGAFVPVTYDGAPGVLVLRRPDGDTQVADLYLCGLLEPLRSVTLPAP